MIWGIIGAMDIEVQLLLDKMQVKEKKEVFGTTFYQGILQGKEVVLVCCGVGKINAALCANTIIREFHADCVINIGIAGSLSKELSIFDVVISNKVSFHDIDLDLYEKFYPYLRFFQPDPKLMELCTTVIENQKNRTYQYQLGHIVTGDEFVESSEMKTDIINRLSPLCVEMEGAAIAQVATVNETPFLILRTISDTADDDATEIYDHFFEDAAHISAQIMLDLLETATL